jgi:hypothetical protein
VQVKIGKLGENRLSIEDGIGIAAIPTHQLPAARVAADPKAGISIAKPSGAELCHADFSSANYW